MIKSIECVINKQLYGWGAHSPKDAVYLAKKLSMSHIHLKEDG